MPDLCAVKVRDTKDGSRTLEIPERNVFYHSVHGAWSETQHVFGEQGIEWTLGHIKGRPIRVLEVGFGTGLNLLETWRRCHAAGRLASVDSLEPFPLAWSDVAGLNYDALTGVPREVWQGMHGRGEWKDDVLQFQRVETGLHEAPLAQAEYDLVMFDAFAPSAQPELWSTAAMDKLRYSLKPGGCLVTYCAKGEVRRAMERAGFFVERLPGPPGKREMLRATRPRFEQGQFNVRVYMMLTRTGPISNEKAMSAFRWEAS